MARNLISTSQESLLRWNPTVSADANRGLHILFVMLGLLSPYVFIEPAPYDFVLILTCALCVQYAFSKHTRTVALFGFLHYFFVLMAIFAYALKYGDLTLYAYKYTFTQAYFTCSFIILFAIFKSHEWVRHEFVKWMLFGAVVSSALVILLHYTIAPDEIYRDNFRSRIKGFFEDPNVLGPYLILPITYAVFSSKFRLLSKIAMVLPMVTLILLSFSRAAAIGLVISLITTAAFYIWTRKSISNDSMLLASIALIAATALGFLPQISKLLPQDAYALQRLQLQDYDSVRFEHIIIGFKEGITNFFGLGPGKFELLYGNNPHNLFIGRLTDAGWVPTLITIIAIFVALYKSFLSGIRRRDTLSICIFGALVAHGFISMVIHSHHWRHLLLLIVLGMTAQTIRAKPALNASAHRQSFG